MRIDTHIGPIQKSEVGASAYDALVRFCPEGDYKTYFKGVFSPGDSRLDYVLSFLKRLGYSPNDGKSHSKSRAFKRWHQRVYEKNDFEDSCLLEFTPRLSVEAIVERTADGILAVSSDYEGPAPAIGRIEANAVAVSERLKLAMMKFGFAYVEFLPAIVIGENARALKESYWELTSNLRLPQLSKKSLLVDGLGGLYIDGKSHTCIVDDGFSPPELRYHASDLARIGSFDLARTHEPIGSKAGQFIVSKRFYDFCELYELEIDWVPVRIDPD